MSSRTGVPRRTLRLCLAALAAAFTASLLVALPGLLGGVPSASAQASLVESIPEDGAVLDGPPTQVLLRFDEAIGSSNRVSIACNSDPFTSFDQPVVADDSLSLTVEMLSPMPAGTCRVSWQVSEPTGEPGAEGSFTFSIEESPVTTPGGTTAGTTGDTQPSATTPDATPDTTPAAGAGEPAAPGEEEVIADADEVTSWPAWGGRVLSAFGLAVLFGSFILIVAAWPEGPEYVLAVRFLRSVWIVTLLGSLLYVVALSAGVRGESFGRGADPSGWLDLLDAGLPGQAALARLVLVLATGWVVLRPERVIDPTTQLPAVAIPALAVVTVGLSRSGGDWEAVGIGAGVLHALAMAVWVGGAVLLARVVLAGPGDEDLVHAVRGFSRISGPAIVVTVVTGLVQLYRLVGGTLFSSGHGRLLLVKSVLVAVMLFLGMTARQLAGIRLARTADLPARLADRLRRSFGVEAVIGVVVLGLSGALLSLTPGKAPERGEISFAIEESVVDPGSGIELVVMLDPGRVGLNRLRVEVGEPDSGLAGLEITFTPPVGSATPAITQTIPLSGRGIADSGPAAGVPLDVAGAWSFQVNATSPTGAISGAGSSFEVRNADGSLASSEIDSPPTAPPVTPAPTTAAPTTPGTAGDGAATTAAG